MTREEYKKEIFGKPSSSKVYKSAKKYIALLEAQLKAKDERIKELEEAMKPKTCDGCKWWDFNSDGVFKKCFNGKGNCTSTEADFGCIRHEPKGNK